MDWAWFTWQATISTGVYLVIKMNGRGWTVGWLCGFLVQCLQIGYAIATQSWGYLFAAAPAVAFLQVWLQKRKTPAMAEMDMSDADKARAAEAAAKAAELKAAALAKREADNEAAVLRSGKGLTS